MLVLSLCSRCSLREIRGRITIYLIDERARQKPIRPSSTFTQWISTFAPPTCSPPPSLGYNLRHLCRQNRHPAL